MRNLLLHIPTRPVPPPRQFEPEEESKNTLFEYAKPVRKFWLFGVLLGLLAFAIDLFVPQVLGHIVNELLGEKRSEQLVWLGGALVFAIAVAQTILRFTNQWIMTITASRNEINIRMRLFDKLLRQPLSFFNRWSSGQLLQRSMDDLNQIRFWFAAGLWALFSTSLVILIGLVMMFQISPLLAGIYAASVPFVIGITIWYVRTFGEATRKSQQMTGDLTTRVEESVHGLRVLKALGRGDHALKQFDKQAEELRILETRRIFLYAIMTSANIVLFGVTAVLVLWLGVLQVASGEISLGALVTFFATAMVINSLMQGFGQRLGLGLNARVALERHRMVANEVDEEDVDLGQDESETAENTAAAKQLGTGAARLTFRDVTFAYTQKSDPVLQEFSLDIAPGETIALLGVTGAGKSTVLELAASLYQPKTGEILCDGVSFTELPLRTARAQIAMAFEEPVLMSDSVRNNVLMGADTAALSKDEQDALLAEALDIAAAEFVQQLPEKADTNIGEEGLSLSGGQRQRLSLARAIAAKPRILLLDDPLSALDVNTEKRVVQKLQQTLTQTTTLLTAKRPSTVALASRVAILSGGKIAAIGTPAEISKHPLYRELMVSDDEAAPDVDAGELAFGDPAAAAPATNETAGGKGGAA
ncbi:MAG: ABC transporter ATP-binding protein [Microbacteriaceae bacterium]|nr:ABC transporter ATP-binding protein [Microbacteriaceae bacterium]